MWQAQKSYNVCDNIKLIWFKHVHTSSSDLPIVDNYILIIVNNFARGITHLPGDNNKKKLASTTTHTFSYVYVLECIYMIKN